MRVAKVAVFCSEERVFLPCTQTRAVSNGISTRTSEKLRMQKKSGNVLIEALTESEAFAETVQWLTREQYA
jgi:hypothetical protein